MSLNNNKKDNEEEVGEKEQEEEEEVEEEKERRKEEGKERGKSLHLTSHIGKLGFRHCGGGTFTAQRENLEALIRCQAQQPFSGEEEQTLFSVMPSAQRVSFQQVLSEIITR